MTSDQKSKSFLFRLAMRLASFRLGSRMEEILDDLAILYESWSRSEGRRTADRKVLSSALNILCLGVGERRLRPSRRWPVIMLRNDFKLAGRSLRRRPGYSGITVFGLAVGMACCLLILTYARHEWTFDTFHQSADSIFRVHIHAVTPGGETEIKAGQPIGLATEIDSSFDEVLFAAPVIVNDAVILETEGRSFEQAVLYTTPSFFDVFTFPFVHGSKEYALLTPESVVLTASTARQFFGETDVLDKTLRLFDSTVYRDLVVAGVVDDPPANSSIQFTVIQPVSEWSDYDTLVDSWTSWVSNTYVRLARSSDQTGIESRLGTFTAEHYAPMIQTWQILQWISGEDNAFSLHFQPLRDIHFSPEVQQAQARAIDPLFPWFLFGLASAVLIIACINFTTLSIGRAVRRSKEVGMRKVLGAARLQLLSQFWSEALLMSGIALVLAMVLTAIFLPMLEGVTGSDLSIAIDGQALLVLGGLFFLTGLLAGAYPSFYLSQFRPENVIKAGSSATARKHWMPVLVIVQFTLSIAFIVALMVVSEQLRYMKDKDLGFSKERVVVVETYSTDPEESTGLVENLKSEWERIPEVLNIAASSSGFSRRLSWNSFGAADGDAHFYYVNRIDRDFLETMELNIIDGQGFSSEFPSEPDGKLIVNEALVRDFNWDDPIGEEVGNFGEVTGVVSDYFFKSVHTTVEPMALFLSSKGDDPFRYVYVRMGPANVPATLVALEDSWSEMQPDRPFSWYFLDDDLNRLYADEQRIQQIVSAAGVFSILIACLGLFGLAAFAAERRKKEIGIRKVVGAGLGSVVGLVSREFLVLVAIAIVFATPLAWFAMDEWLSGFAYRIEMKVWMPLVAAGLAVFIAMITVSYHAIRAALSDPVKSLRLE